MSKLQWGVVIVLVLAIVIIFGAVVVISYDAPEDLKYDPIIKSAYAECQRLTLGRLKAPSSAEFPPRGEMRATRKLLGNWEIRFWVDAQNSFGALIRSDVYCKVRDRNNAWQLVTLEIEQR